MAAAKPLTLIFEHPDFFVLNKPAGMSFHREVDGSGNDETSLMDAARSLLNGMALFPVHRLDRITSGLILLARSQVVAAQLGEAFSKGQIQKYYLAISARQPQRKQGMIKGAMVKGRDGSWRLAGQSGQDGSVAVTQFMSYGLGKLEPSDSALRLFVLRPRTGKTHQLRVALKSLGSPILGDRRYGGAPADRGYLHAWQLQFEWHGEILRFVAPPVEGLFFQQPALLTCLEEIGQPEDLPWPRWGRL